MRSRVTIREVAARAGVSHQTVSRVINHDRRVRDETRLRVETAIADLGFQPNAIAQSMAKGQTRTLACISPNLTDYTFASIIENVEAEARNNDYYVISVSASDEQIFGKLIKELIGSRRTDGLLVINPFTDNRYHLVPPDVPVVFIGIHSRSVEIGSISLNDFRIGYDATSHLINLGHRMILHITGPMNEDCAKERLAGFQTALEEAEISLDPALIQHGDWSADSGFNIVRWVLDNNISFSALFAQNDRMAIGGIHALREAGKRVPEDISIIGVDDIPLSPHIFPPLTTLRQNIVQIGSEAAKLLIGAIENPKMSPQHLQVNADLIVRESTRHI